MSPKRRKHRRAASEGGRSIPIDGPEGTDEGSADESPRRPDADEVREASPVEAARSDADTRDADTRDGDTREAAASDEAASDDAATAEPVDEAPTPEAIAQARVGELEDRLKRVQAEFVNETKRINRQADDRTKYAIEALVNDLLPVFDAMHSARDGFAGRARAAEEAHDESAVAADQAALEGFELVEKELMNVLARHGVGRIEAVGSVFDPALHHAIVMVDRDDLEPGQVAMELRPGFTLNGRVVRPAHVAVVAAEKES